MPVSNDLLLTVMLLFISDMKLNLSLIFIGMPTPLLQFIRVTVADRRRQACTDLFDTCNDCFI